MKMKSKSVISMFLVVVLALFVVAIEGQVSQASDKVYNIKFATNPAELTPDTSPDTCWAYTLRDYIEKQSGGRLKLDLYPSAQLGGHAEIAQGVAGGSIEMGIVNLSVLTSLDRNIMAFTIPGLFSNTQECTDILNSDVAREIFSKLEQDMKFRIIYPYCNGYRNFTNSKKELKIVEDVRGLSFRVMEDPVSIAMVEAIGAKAVPMSASEMYLAMQNGVVDGHENTITNVIQDLTYEVQKSMVLDKHTASVSVTLISQTWFDSLPKDLQQIIMDGQKLAFEASFALTERLNEEGVAILREKGMAVYEPTPEELADWQNAILSTTSAYVRQQIGDALVDKVISEIEIHRK
jgi:tripartite ATP-independent transporter DctP family solute receptor